MNWKEKRLFQRFRVPLGFLFAIIFLAFARPTLASLAVGTAIALVGLLIRAWASGHIRKNQALAVAGPYAFTQNPLYFGSFILGLGFTIASGVWWLGLIFIAFFLGIYLPVMRVESGDLRQLFGDEYRKYAGNVPLFFPRIRAYKAPNGKFEFNLYMRYREYRAVVGAVLALGVLVVKVFFLK